MSTLVFVFGTLKAGFPNASTNQGFRIPGRFRTQAKFPLYLVGERNSPWMLNTPGVGHHVVGELYQVDASVLASMDLLERVHEPDGYIRTPIVVLDEDSSKPKPITAHVYLKRPELFEPQHVQLGPLPEYLPEHGARYRRRAA